MKHPPGTIILALGEVIRSGSFVRSLIRVTHPPGTAILMKQSVGVVPNLNECIRNMVGEWIWIQADDHVFPDDTLVRLLDRDVDVVVPFMLMRSPPFRPVVFKDFIEGQGYMPYSWADLPATGLVNVLAAGTGGMLVRKHVLDAIGDPWFVYGEGQWLNEDLIFCRRIREAGFEIMLDVETQMGHVGSFTVAPTRDGDRWDVRVGLGPASQGKTNTIVLRTEEQDTP